MREYPDDITYCDNKNCLKECKRNLALYDFKGCIYSVTDFSKVESYTEDYCPYYWELKRSSDNNELPR